MFWDDEYDDPSDEDRINEEIERAEEAFNETRITDFDGIKAQVVSLVEQVSEKLKKAEAEKDLNKAAALKLQLYYCENLSLPFFEALFPDIWDDEWSNTYEINLIGDSGVEVRFRRLLVIDPDPEYDDDWDEDVGYFKIMTNVGTTPVFDVKAERVIVVLNGVQQTFLREDENDEE